MEPISMIAAPSRIDAIGDLLDCHLALTTLPPNFVEGFHGPFTVAPIPTRRPQRARRPSSSPGWLNSINDVIPAVHVEGFAGDESRGIECQKRYRCADVVDAD